MFFFRQISICVSAIFVAVFLCSCSKEDIVDLDTDFKVQLNDSIYMNIQINYLFQVPTITSNGIQGASISNNYLFICHDFLNVIDVIDLNDNSLFTYIEYKENPALHANTVNFSSYYYEKGDMFPLLYVQERGANCVTHVYRIITGKDRWSLEEVQKISFYNASSLTTALDNEARYLYCFYSTNSSAFLGKTEIPSLEKTEVEIDVNDLDNPFQIQYKYTGQDACIADGIFFKLYGGTGQGELRLVDLVSQELFLTIDLAGLGYKSEPESIAYDFNRQRLILIFVDRSVYELYFELVEE